MPISLACLRSFDSHSVSSFPAIHRVLMVDDYAPWCRYVSSTLQDDARWQNVGEVSDGAEAVERAAALQPDLILLDIGLPTINGIEAAHRILDNNPAARILFVSEERSWDVAEAALATGARGYVIKAEAGRELLPAIETVASGGRFVSAALGGRAVEDTGEGPSRAACWHEALFCADDAELLEAWVRFAHDALQAGDAFIIASTGARRGRLRTRLEALGVDVADAIATRRYQSLDIETVMAAFMVDDRPDEKLFWEAAISLMMGAARAAEGARPRIAVCGEVAPTLWKQGHPAAAVQLERLWHELSRTFNVDTLCGYCMPAAALVSQDETFRHIQAAHSAVYSR